MNDDPHDIFGYLPWYESTVQLPPLSAADRNRIAGLWPSITGIPVPHDDEERDR